jgi:hypothetical protein
MLRGSSRVSSPPKLALIPPAAKSHCDQWLPYAKESCLGHSYAPFLRAACMSWLSVWGYKDLVSLPRHGITLLHHPGSIAAQDSCDYLCQDCITAQLLPLLNPFLHFFQLQILKVLPTNFLFVSESATQNPSGRGYQKWDLRKQTLKWDLGDIY